MADAILIRQETMFHVVGIPRGADNLVTFHAIVDDDVTPPVFRTLHMKHDDVVDMGNPTVLTVRVEPGDHLNHGIPEALAAARQSEAEIVKAVYRARQDGRSWTDIGTALGVSRQSAWERFSPHMGGNVGADLAADDT